MVQVTSVKEYVARLRDEGKILDKPIVGHLEKKVYISKFVVHRAEEYFIVSSVEYPREVEELPNKLFVPKNMLEFPNFTVYPNDLGISHLISLSNVLGGGPGYMDPGSIANLRARYTSINVLELYQLQSSFKLNSPKKLTKELMRPFLGDRDHNFGSKHTLLTFLFNLISGHQFDIEVTRGFKYKGIKYNYSNMKVLKRAMLDFHIPLERLIS
jgi:hypothetical protein